MEPVGVSVERYVELGAEALVGAVVGVVVLGDELVVEVEPEVGVCSRLLA